MKQFALLMVSIVCLSACKTQTTEPESGLQRRQASLKYMAPRATLSDTLMLYGALRTTVMTSERFNGGPTAEEQYETQAIFYDNMGNVISPWSVKLNGISIPSLGSGAANVTGSSLSFGITHHWKMRPVDSTVIYPVDDSIMAPNLFRVTFPSPQVDTISKSSGFTVAYTNPGTDSVYIDIFFDSTRTTLDFDSSIHSSYNGYIGVTVPNTGSHFINSSLLSPFPNRGIIEVWVMAARAKVVPVMSRNYLFLSTSCARSFSFIKN